jgi:lipoyl synthase
LSQKNSQLPEQIRVSTGTAIVLGLAEGKLDAAPTTAYLMTYKSGKCIANCGFCPQARNSQSRAEMLSRVSWPTFPTEKTLSAITNSAKTGKIRRVCIQSLNYPQVFSHLQAIVKEIKSNSSVPVSVSCQPLKAENIRFLKEAGVDRLGIAMDAATPTLFDAVKGRGVGSNYRWEGVFGLIRQALQVFGGGNVSTHLIVGLGESEREAVSFVGDCVGLGVLPALFAFTPVHGTALEKCAAPKIEVYRRIQLARYLLVNGKAKLGDFGFDADGRICGFGISDFALKETVESGVPFQTSGCQDCNRPYYNEKPSGPIYNYPRTLTKMEIEKIKTQLGFLS